MDKGELIEHGREENAQECSYSFRPGCAFLAGSSEHPVTFSSSVPTPRVVVEPGQMVWIRTHERVLMPKAMVGFWWQTNTLSRKGLMLVNMSMVEPGYCGDLACLFVNFGKGKVLIDAETTVAKMVFVDIRGDVNQPYELRSPRDRYDSKLNELSLEQPSSFLQVGELASDLKSAREMALADIKSVANSVKIDAEADLAKARVEAISDFKKDIPGVILKSSAWALGAFAILTAVGLGTEYIKGNFTPNVKELARQEAESVLRERVSISSTPNTEENARLVRQIDMLNKRLSEVEKKNGR